MIASFAAHFLIRPMRAIPWLCPRIAPELARETRNPAWGAGFRRESHKVRALCSSMLVFRHSMCLRMYRMNRIARS